MNSMTLKMLHSMKPFQCPKCNSPYASKDAARYHDGARFPRILTCHHSICEKCLQCADKKNVSLPCPTCKELINLEDDDSFGKFPPDVHALGILSANMRNALPSLKVKMVHNDKRYQSQDSLKGSSHVCGHCHKNQALWQCDECQLNFCSLCFQEVHHGKSEKKHEQKRIFAESYNSMVQEGCPEHENKSVEFYCELDNELTCSYCMLMGKHVGHDVKTLVDKNKSCADDIKHSLDGLIHLQKRLKYTDHLLSEVIPKQKVDITDILKNVHDYFHKMHSALQMREAELISELMEISQRPVKLLEEMRFKVADYERNLASLKKDAESVIENPHLAVSAPAVLKKLEEYKDIPCHLVPLLDGSEKNFDLNLDLDSNFEEEFKQIGKIHFSVKPRFALLPSSDLPENFCTDIPESFSAKFKASLDTESLCDSLDTFSEDSLSVNTEHSSHSSVQASFKYRDYAKMQPEKVVVSHLISPSSFFVQRSSDLRKLRTMSDAIDKWCKSYESMKYKVFDLEPGNLYLVQYSKDKKWYRGRVKSIYKSEKELDETICGPKSPSRTEDGKLVVKNREPKALVYYIDYGNTEIVSLSEVKNIQPRFLSLPGIAKECSLADIEPVKKGEWCVESIKAFAKFVDNKVVIMQVYEEKNNIYVVDLCQCPDSDISSDVPVSIRDALVFLELAVFPCGMKRTRKKKVNRDYMPPEPLRMNVNICAIVSHVNDPYNLYVQQMSTASYLAKLIFEMNETYNDEVNTSLHSIYAPCVGMVCAARFSLDKQWYRAKVLDLPGGSMVKVQYVDFGNTEVIHHKHLRKLFDKFFKLNIQAIPCKLAHITYSGAGWNKEARKWLTSQVSRKQLTLKSLGMIPGENKAEILLYYTDDDTEICVNALMVEEGLVLSTGAGSNIVRKRKDGFVKKMKTPPKTSAPNLDHFVIPPPQPAQIILGDYEDYDDSMPNTSPKSPQKTTASEQTLKNEGSPVHAKNKKYPSLASPLEGTSHIEVLVSHVISPGSFYIRIAGDKEKKLTLLMDDLQKVYENLQGEIVECNIGKAYAVFCTNRKKWFRGTVVEKINDSIVKVHYVDYGNTEDVEKKYIRKLQDKFVGDESFSVRCHLDGIIPAGGSSNWSHSACDNFKQLVAGHESLLLSGKGDIVQETKSLPADLLIEKLIRGGALEPTKIEYVSITSEIVKYGYALPIRRKSRSPTKENVEQTIKNTPEIDNSSGDVISIPNSVFSNEASQPVQIGTSKPMQIQEPEPPEMEPELPPEKPTFQWKPAVPPLESSFKGYVTNIGDDGSIHLYVLNDGTSQVETISKALQFKYNKTENYKCLKKLPPVGEACVAKFSLDNSWYRAEVVSVYPGPPSKVKVNFVDYGNNEIVPLSFIRTDLCMKDFPRQCLECALFGISDNPKLVWDKDLLTFLHTQLVDSEVSVEVQAAPDKQGRLQTLIRTTSGIDLSELLLSMGFDDPSETTEFEETCSAVPDTFTRALELRKGDIYPVCVTLLPSKNIVYLQILKIPSPQDEFELELNETHDAFLQLIAILQEKAEKFPKLQEPMPGVPCCAKYSYDENWYRCEVTDLCENGVVVLYVDYGNSETVPTDNLRKLEPQFIDFPIQVQICELYGLKPTGDDLNPETKDMLLKIPNQQLFAKVMVPGRISQVELLIKTDDGDYKPALETLAEKKVAVTEL